jgi:hypothetical protein
MLEQQLKTDAAARYAHCGHSLSRVQVSKVWKLLESRQPRKQSTSRPRQQQDWIAVRLQGGRVHPLAACAVATLETLA